MKKRSASIALAAAAIAAGANFAAAENPLKLPERRQSFELEFANPEQAAAARLSVLPLPEGKKLAFSARWDDTNPAHLNTHAAMAANGVKGSFYLCAGNAGTGEDYCKKLLESGCSVGLHTKTHPFLPKRNPNEQFYEIMSVKAEREADCDAASTSMVFPFNQFADGADKEAQKDVGQAMMNAGFISVPTSYSLNFGLEKALGYPEGSLAESWLLVPGDREPSAEKAEKDLAQAEASLSKPGPNPCVTIGIHSWHTPEGLKSLDAILKKLSGRKDWWYCNQNEYGAYRYEAKSCRLEKRAEGAKAVFSLYRALPAELGASVPLWFKVEGAEPLKAAGGAKIEKLDGETYVVLPQPEGSLLPSLIASVEANGAAKALKSAKMPFLSASLAADLEKGKLKLELENAGSESLKDLRVAFRSPSTWENGVIRFEAPELPPGAKKTFEASLGARKEGLRYRPGQPYFSVQTDFQRGAQACRLYAGLRTPAGKLGSEAPLNSLKAFAPLAKELDFAKLSEPSAALSAFGQEPLDISKDKDRSSPWAIPFNVPREKLPKEPFKSAAVFDFESSPDAELSFDSKGAEIYFNGAKLPGDGAKSALKPLKGANRLVAVYQNKDQRLQPQLAVWSGAANFAESGKP